MIISCAPKEEQLVIEVYETSANGNNLTKLENFGTNQNESELVEVIPPVPLKVTFGRI